jgi:hypothetical protein
VRGRCGVAGVRAAQWSCLQGAVLRCSHTDVLGAVPGVWPR